MGIVRDLYMARKIGAGTKLPAPTVASLVKRLMLASIIGGAGEKKTARGALVHITDALAKAALSVLASIEPIQDLHGYDHPWPAGGGKNKLPPTTSVSGTQNGVTFTVNSDGSVSTSGTATGTAIFTYFINFTDLTENEQYILSGCPTGGGMSSKYKLDYRVSGGYITDTGAGASFTFVPLSSENSIRIVVYSGTNASGLVFKPMIRLASVSDATFAPYSNICPITGRTGLSVYVSPTQDVADATTYAVDWTTEAGTVYGGSNEIVSGKLTSALGILDMGSLDWTAHSSGNFYAEDTILDYVANRYAISTEFAHASDATGGVSSLTANGSFAFQGAQGYTKTRLIIKNSAFSGYTGAQVGTALSGQKIVYELATPLTYQLTPQEVQILLGENYVWSSSGDDVSVTYVADGTANNRQALRILLGDSYSNQGTTDDVSDKEALDIILGGNK